MTSDANDLDVDFAGEVHRVSTRLTFGRDGDIRIDDNPYLHRIVGEFVADNGIHWLRNVGSRIVVNLAADDGHRASVPPGSAVALTPGTSGSVRFNGGRTAYEIVYQSNAAALAEQPRPRQQGSTTELVMLLTPREVDYLVSFAEPILTGSGRPLPTYAEVARRWGVSLKTLDNTIQLWKQKLRAANFSTDAPLDSLLRTLIEHGLLTSADLAWAALDDDPPRSAADGPRFTLPGNR